MQITQTYLPITDKWQYKIQHDLGRCVSAGKIQEALKLLDNIPIFNKNFTQQEMDDGTSIFFKEPNGVSCTKDNIWIVTDIQLTQQQLDKINSRLQTAKINIDNFLD